MTCSERARTTIRRIPGILVAGLQVAMAEIAAAVGHRLLASSSGDNQIAAGLAAADAMVDRVAVIASGGNGSGNG